MKIIKTLILTALLLPSSALAALPEVTGKHFTDGILSTIIYGAIGTLMALAGVKIIDLLTPGNLSAQICEEKNQALAIVVAAFILGICIIIAAAIAS
jgi:putative membrane protein